MGPFRHPTRSFRLRDRGSLQDRIYLAIRERILDGSVASGERLPSSRELAEAFCCARATVTAAFDRLVAEGYVEGRQGSGSYVRQEPLARPAPTRLRRVPAKVLRTGFAERLASDPSGALRRDGRPRAFQVAVPAIDAFPVATWARLSAAVWRRAPASLLTYQDRRGRPELRAAIARYLGAERGVRCTAEQVLVTNGSQQALRFVAELLVDPGDEVWMEEPGYYGARSAFVDAGARLQAIPVDDDGLIVAEAQRLAPRAKLAYVTPRHQMPLGVTLSAARRLALLAWATQADALVVEDDYDAELLLRGRSLPTLHELDGGRRVFHVGSFSFVVFPGVRIGYVVVPESLLELFGKARASADLGASGIEQAVLTRFIAEGHLHRHVRKMRRLYAERATVLADEARSALPQIRVTIGDVGMHAVAWLPEDLDPASVVEHARTRGLEVRPLDVYRSVSVGPPAIVLGYGALSPRALREGVRTLARVLGEVARRGRLRSR